MSSEIDARDPEIRFPVLLRQAPRHVQLVSWNLAFWGIQNRMKRICTEIERYLGRHGKNALAADSIRTRLLSPDVFEFS